MVTGIGHKTQLWLGILFFALFFLFPTVTQWSNIPLLLILITWATLLRKFGVKVPIQRLPIVWVLISIYGLVLLGLMYTPATSDWYNLHLRKYARFLYAAVLICVLAGHKYLQDLALKGFLTAMVFIVISTWLAIWLPLPWSASQTQGWNQSHHIFGDYITQNLMVSLFVVLCLHQGVQQHGLKKWPWWVMAAMAIISVTNLSQGRTGFIVLFVALVTFIVINLNGRHMKFAFLGLFIGAALIYTSSEIMQQRFEQATTEAKNSAEIQKNSIGGRIYNYKTTVSMFLEKPIIGHGTGAYHTEICRFLNDPQDCAIFNWHPHNQFLFLGAEHGIFGILLYILLISLMYTLALKSLDHTGKVLLATLSSMMLVNSLVNSPWWSSRESQFFAFMLGLGVAMTTNHMFRSKSSS